MAEREPEMCYACGDADISDPRDSYSAVVTIGHGRGTSHRVRYAVRWSERVCLGCKDALVEDVALAFAHRLKRLRGRGAGQSCPAVQHTGDCARNDCIGCVCKAIVDGAYERRRGAAIRVRDGDLIIKYMDPDDPDTMRRAEVPPARTRSSGRRPGLWARIYAFLRSG